SADVLPRRAGQQPNTCSRTWEKRVAAALVWMPRLLSLFSDLGRDRNEGGGFSISWGPEGDRPSAAPSWGPWEVPSTAEFETENSIRSSPSGHRRRCLLASIVLVALHLDPLAGLEIDLGKIRAHGFR